MINQINSYLIGKAFIESLRRRENIPLQLRLKIEEDRKKVNEVIKESYCLYNPEKRLFPYSDYYLLELNKEGEEKYLTFGYDIFHKPASSIKDICKDEWMNALKTLEIPKNKVKIIKHTKTLFGMVRYLSKENKKEISDKIYEQIKKTYLPEIFDYGAEKIIPRTLGSAMLCGFVGSLIYAGPLVHKENSNFIPYSLLIPGLTTFFTNVFSYFIDPALAKHYLNQNWRKK